jgi:hypothetical protein
MFSADGNRIGGKANSRTCIDETVAKVKPARALKKRSA